MECFSALPRLLRDAHINEQWEGPRNLLLNQIHRDLRRVSDWYPPGKFAADTVSADESLTDELERLVTADIFDQRPAPDSMATARQWDEFVQTFFHAYQEGALSRIQSAHV